MILPDDAGLTCMLTTDLLDVPGARLHHEVRGSGPLLALIGSPMDADSFAVLADLLAVDHTVLTADPRGIHRSPLDDREQDSTPELRADDLARLLVHLDAGPAVVFGSSGGAVTALALAQSRPELLRAVIAHEPPIHGLLADRDALNAAEEKMVALYAAGDPVGAWAAFLAIANIDMPAEVLVAEPGSRHAADERRGFLHEMGLSSGWMPDLAALRAGPTRIVIGIGEDSTGQVCDRTSRALAAALDVEPTIFPGGHIGFADDAAAFEPSLRTVLGRLI